NPAAAIAYLLSGFRGPVVLTWHSDICRQRLLKRLFAPIERLMVRRSRAIIASSLDYIAYSSILYEHRALCRVIPFGIPIDQFRKPNLGAVSRIRTRYGDRLLLSVGRMVEYKGYRYLIHAMSTVNATLLLIGEGPERERLEADARRLGVEDRVAFLGKVDNISPYYQACDIFVLPSITRNEAFGLVQLEAMPCGNPVVNTHLRSGVPFVWANGLTGITVPPADSDSLARVINRLLDDPGRRMTYGEAGMRRVKEEFSLRQMVDRTVELYTTIMAADRRPAAEPFTAIGRAQVAIAD